MNTISLNMTIGKLVSSSTWTQTVVHKVSGNEWIEDIKWYVNSDWLAISRKKLIWETPWERAENLLQQYWRNNYDERKQAWKQYWYKTEFLICLAQSETWIWQEKKSLHNYFNCWNNDRWDTLSFSSFNNAVRSLHEVCLWWTYLWSKQSLWQLSPKHKDSSCYWRTDWNCKYVYASSSENRLNNMRNCLSNIRGEQVEEDYLFRK